MFPWGMGARGMTSRDEALESMQRTIQPPCPRCGKRMTLTRVDPHSPAHQVRTLDCLRCGYSDRRNRQDHPIAAAGDGPTIARSESLNRWTIGRD
jgi:predicted RNA-binding Zn-ribbon protein involved in translation (DUF1610 family)